MMDHLKTTSVLAAGLGTLAMTIVLIGLPTVFYQIGNLEAQLKTDMAQYASLVTDVETLLKGSDTPHVAKYKRQVRSDGRLGVCPGGTQPLTTRHGLLIECKTSFCVEGFRCMPDFTCCPINGIIPEQAETRVVEPLVVRECVKFVVPDRFLAQDLKEAQLLQEEELKKLGQRPPIQLRSVGSGYGSPATAPPQPAYNAGVDNTQQSGGGQCNCQEPPENKCPAGPAGEPGAAGEDGEDGANGEPGRPGADAEALKQCGRDPVCEPCPEGPQGSPGAKGPRGRPGSDGRDGSKGANGKNGDNGSQGAPGSDGPTGKAGGPGKQGPKGKDGVKSATGSPGRKGPTGPKGPAGPPGSPGKSVNGAGPQGEPGSTGPVGSAGSVGPDGPAGRESGTPGRAGNDAEYCPCPPRRNGRSDIQQQFSQRRRLSGFRGFNKA